MLIHVEMKWRRTKKIKRNDFPLGPIGIKKNDLYRAFIHFKLRLRFVFERTTKKKWFMMTIQKEKEINRIKIIAIMFHKNYWKNIL